MRNAAITLACALALALGAAGCGGGGEDEHEPIPADLAAEMETQLDLTRERFEDGICGSAARQVRELMEKAERIPSDTDPAVRREIRGGLDHLASLVESDCERPEEDEDDTETTETEQIPTTTAPAPEPEPEPEPEQTQTQTQPEIPDEIPEPEFPDDGGAEAPGNSGGTPPGQRRRGDG